MAATRILKQAAKDKLPPREWLLKKLNEAGSQFSLAADLGESPAAISRALAEFKILEMKRYRFEGYHHKTEREWMRDEDLMRRRDWQELR